MKSIDKKIFFLALNALFLSFSKAYAVDLNLGIGESYNFLSNTSSLSSDPSKHSGFAYLGEAHLGFGKRRFGMSFDLFGMYEMGTLNNIDSTQSETNKRSGYGGGVDIFIKSLFLGAGYERVTSEITTNGSTSASFKYDEFSGRAGVMISVNRHLSFILGGSVGLGKANFTSVSNVPTDLTTRNFRGFLLLNLSLVGESKAYERQ